MDACAKANIGLIAMKTQRSEAGIAGAWKKFEQTGKWSKHQAVLKAVWADPRISAAVSQMDNLDKLAGVDFSGAGRACPHGVDVVALMERAQKVLT